MMKYFVPILMLLSVAACKKTACAGSEGSVQKTVRHVGPIRDIELNGAVNLVLTQAATDKIEVEAGSNILPSVQTTMQDGLLTIENKAECPWLQNPSQQVTVHVQVNNLRSIVYKGSGTIICSNAITSDTLRFFTNIGAGNVNLQLDCNYLWARCEFESTTLNLTGRADAAYVYGNARSSMNLKNFVVKNLDFGWVGAKDVTIQATEKLRAVLYHTGNVYYKGNPAEVKTIYYSTGRLFTAP